MLNVPILNTSVLNSGTPAPAGASAADTEAIEFDGYGLQNTAIISELILTDSAPSRDVVSFKTPRRDGGGILAADFAGRSVVVRGIIKAASASALATAMDTFKKRVCKQEKNLDINLNDTVRRCTATLVNPQSIFGRRQGYHITDCPFDLEFLSMDPFFKEVDYTASSELSKTDLSLNKDVVNQGSWKSDLDMVIIVDAATSITALTVTNNTNDDALTITENINAGDVIRIMGSTKSVTINGTEVEYSGTFPELETGDNSLTFAWTGTSLTWNLTVKHKKTYL